MERFADEVLMNAIGVMKTMNDCYGELTEPLDIVRYKFLQELKEYRDTGLTPEQVRELAEKQKPMKVEPGLYPLNGADENSLVVTTVDFALTYFVVSGELERSGDWL